MKIIELNLKNKNFKNFSDVTYFIKRNYVEDEESCFIKAYVKNCIDVKLNNKNYYSDYGNDKWNLDDINGNILYISKRFTEYKEEDIEEEIGTCTSETFWHCQGTRKNGQCLNCTLYSLYQEEHEVLI